MFNLSGSEIIVILLLALVVLGPEKLPDAIRRAGRTYSELKKMGNSFQAEMKSVLDEPMKEMRETADLLKKSVDFTDGELTGNTPTPPRVPAVSKESAAATPTGATSAAAGATSAEVAAVEPATRADDGPGVGGEDGPTSDPTSAAPSLPSASRHDDDATAAVEPPAATPPSPDDDLINRTLRGEA